MNAMFPLAMIADLTVFAEHIIVGQRLEKGRFFGTEYDHQALCRRIDRSDRGLC